MTATEGQPLSPPDRFIAEGFGFYGCNNPQVANHMSKYPRKEPGQ